MSTILKYNCVQDTNYPHYTHYPHFQRLANKGVYTVNDYEYVHAPLYQIYRNFGIDGLTRPLLHPNFFHFHTKSVDKTLLNPLIVEILKLGLLGGGFDDYNFNQMREFFNDCDARIYALGSQVTCDNCHIGLGPYWEIKPTRTCLRAVCNNCYNNNDLVNTRSDYQADYCTECGEECGADLCKYCRGDDY